MTEVNIMLIHSLKVAKRVILIVVGFALLAVGLVMSVPLVPGPGLLIVVGALAILAVEFVWARRLLERVKEQGYRIRARFGLGETKSHQQQETRACQ
jgi:uncharacterized protein (TIGR02611 family)